MTADEWAIRDTARTLATLYRELDAAKYERGKPPEVRIMKPSFGPRDPANTFLMSLDADLTSRLFEMVGECRTHIEPTMVLHHHGPRLCEWIAFNAQAVADLPVAPDLLEEMHDQARRITRRIRPTSSTAKVREAAKVAPRRYTAAEAAALASAATGRNIDRKQVTYWGRAKGKGVTPELGPDGTATYDLNEVIEAATAYRDGRRKSG